MLRCGGAALIYGCGAAATLGLSAAPALVAGVVGPETTLRVWAAFTWIAGSGAGITMMVLGLGGGGWQVEHTRTELIQVARASLQAQAVWIAGAALLVFGVLAPPAAMLSGAELDDIGDRARTGWGVLGSTTALIAGAARILRGAEDPQRKEIGSKGEEDGSKGAAADESPKTDPEA